MKRILIFTLLLILSSGISAQINFDNGSWSDIKKRAKKENKLIHVYGSYLVCSSCSTMQGDVFDNPVVAGFYNENFINYKYDVKNDQRFLDKYPIPSVPVTYFIDHDEKLAHMVIGSFDDKDYIKVGADALDPNKQLTSLEKKYDKSKKVDDLTVINYIKALHSAGDVKCDEILTKYLKGRDWKSEENMRLIFLYSYPSLQTTSFTKIVNNRSAFVELFGEEEVMFKIFQAMSNDTRYNYVDPLDSKSLKEHFDKFYNPKSSSYNSQIIQLEKAVYSADYGANNSSLIAIAKNTLKDMPSLPWELYNDTAWEVYDKYDDERNLLLALKWVDRSISISRNTYNLDTKAHLLEKLGRRSEAIEFAKLSIIDGNTRDYDNKHAKELLEKMESN